MIAPAQESLHHLISQYGSFALFGLLAFGIIGLPVPDEFLLLTSGFMAAKGELSLIAIIIAAISGSALGITVSYLLGRFVGHKALLYFGKYVGITEKKLQLAHDWFERLGKYLIFVGYFIPGVRHLTGFVAGATELEYPIFAFFAYLGATVWALLFIFLGYFFFDQWQHFS